MDLYKKKIKNISDVIILPYIYKEIQWDLPKTNSRRELRKLVVKEFMEEEPGHGKRNLASRYKYIVENFPDGRKLYLKRPARVKFGFDFQIWIENWRMENNDIMPSHDDVLKDLAIKKDENIKFFNSLLDAIEKIYNCEDDDTVIEWLKSKNIHFSNGEYFEVILKIIKWMFIEQDIRYWNFSGRNMLKSAIDKNFKIN